MLASDVLYERRNVEQLLELLPQLVTTGEIWIADPGRATAGLFVEQARAAWEVDALPGSEPPVTIHRLRRATPA